MHSFEVGGVFFIIGSTPAYSFKIFNMIMPLNQTQLNIFQVFYFVHMGDSLKSFKIKDYKLSTELLLVVFLRYLLFYCFRCVTPSLMTARARVTLTPTTTTVSTACMTNSKYQYLVVRNDLK